MPWFIVVDESVAGKGVLVSEGDIVDSTLLPGLVVRSITQRPDFSRVEWIETATSGPGSRAGGFGAFRMKPTPSTPRRDAIEAEILQAVRSTLTARVTD
jgi:hypothetical protein